MKKYFFYLFSIFTFYGIFFPQSINITSPHSGDNFIKGNSYDIRWEITGSVNDYVKIRLFNSDMSVKVLNIADRTRNSGGFYWKLPESLNPGQYRIRVKTVDNLFFDDSDIFSISNAGSTLTVLSPNGNEEWIVGKYYKIKWSSPGLTGNVRINLYKDGKYLGPLLRNNNQGIPAGNNEYNWKVGRPINNAEIPKGTGYKIEVKSLSFQSVKDRSDGNFSILNPYAGTIVVKEPSGGDIVKIGDSFLVKWDSKDLADPGARIKIALLKDDMVTKIDYVDGTPPGIGIKNTGKFLWHITDYFQPGNRVLKVMTADGKVFGYSGIFRLHKSDETVDLEVVDISIPKITYSNELSKVSVTVRNRGNNWLHYKDPHINIRLLGMDKLYGGKFTFDRKIQFYNTEFYKGDIKNFNFSMAGLKWPVGICNITFAARIDPGKKIEEKNRKNNFMEKTFYRDEIITGKNCGPLLSPATVKIGKAGLRPVNNNGRIVLSSDRVNIFMKLRNCCSKENLFDMKIIFDYGGREEKVIRGSRVLLKSGESKAFIITNIKIPKKNDFRWLAFKSINFKKRFPYSLGIFYKFKVKVD